MVGSYGISVCQMETRFLLFKQHTVISEVRKCVRNQLQQFIMEDIVRFGFVTFLDLSIPFYVVFV